MRLSSNLHHLKTHPIGDHINFCTGKEACNFLEDDTWTMAGDTYKTYYTTAVLVVVLRPITLSIGSVGV